MKVLSLFDGMSCGQIALNRIGIKPEKYYTSEIDKYAMQITQKNYPDTIQLGDIEQWLTWNIEQPDLILAGSPCQGFSFAGKQLNFDDPRSKLFFDFVNILKRYKPKYFLLENVKMKKDYQNIISDMLGVKPIEINSALVSAQNRKRIYWTNIKVGPITDKDIKLKHIIHESESKEYDLLNFLIPLEKGLHIINKELGRNKVKFVKKYCEHPIYLIHGKEVAFYGVINKPRGNNAGGLRNDGSKSPTISRNSWEHNNHFLFGAIGLDRLNKMKNGQRFNDGKKFYTLTTRDRHGIFTDGYIRKVTPIECERLQTVPDNYTEGVSNTQRYKMLGNGWTVDVICHILKGMK